MEADNTHSSDHGVTSSDPLARVWIERIKQSSKRYEDWAEHNKCAKLERYYQGKQWEPTGTNYEPYVINLFFSTIEVQLPTLLFDNPVYHVKPKPRGMEFDLEMAVKRAQLREDILNTIVGDSLLKFGSRAEMAIMDSFFRFGIIEVGYSANWVENPNADKPILKSDSKPYTDGKGNVIQQPKELPESERIYIKRINAKRFRVGGLEGDELESCNWCGYYEYVRVEDFKANKALKNTDDLSWSGARSADFVKEEYGPEVDHLMQTGDLLKVWYIWDNRKKKKYIFSDPQGYTHFEKSFTRLPIFDLRPHRLTEGWYPLPVVSNWKCAQDEINDSHEQMRNHRKRFTRKYWYNEAAFPDEEELDKLINGGDGTFVKKTGNDPSPVMPIPNADLGAQEGQSLVVTQEDFNTISGSSNEARLNPQKTTATQANIVNQKASIRDSRARIQIANWLARIGREILLLAEEKFSLPVWVKMSVPDGEIGQNLGEFQEIWHKVIMQDLHETEGDGLDFEVNISLDSMSPIANEDEKNEFLLVLATLAQYPELSISPLLIRETCYRLGYRNEKVIVQLQQMAQLKLTMMMGQLEGATQVAQGGGNPFAQQAVANQTPPNNEQMRQQVGSQMGQE